MNYNMEIFIIFNSIFLFNCDKKFLKVKNCTSNENLSHITRCDLVDGKVSIVYDIIKPINKAMVRTEISENFDSKNS